MQKGSALQRKLGHDYIITLMRWGMPWLSRL